MRSFVIITCVLLSGVVCACDDATSVSRVDTAVTVLSEHGVYVSGGVIFELKNPSADTVYIDRCESAVQRRTASGWALLVGRTCSKDPAQNEQPPIPLLPGSYLVDARFASVVFEDGEYRAVFYARLDPQSSARDTVYSNSFFFDRTGTAADIPGTAVRIDSAQVRTIATEFNADISDARYVVVRDVQAWTALWDDMKRNFSPMPPAPAIDFGASTLLAAATGRRPTGGYGVQIAKVYRDGSRLYAEVVQTAPGLRCGVTLAMTSPVHVVAVPRFDGEVLFVIRNGVRDCG